MANAFIVENDRHSKKMIKAREERIRYWTAQGFSRKDAEIEADSPSRRRRRHLHSVVSAPANLEPAANLESAFRVVASEPSSEEILREVERQKRLGKMSEISACEIESRGASTDVASKGPTAYHKIPKNRLAPASQSKKSWPYWMIASAASTWLVHSSAQAFGGGFWNYIIFAAFDYSPVLLLSARVGPDVQQRATWAAFAIFIIGFALYLAPSIQTTINEYASYSDSSARYEADQKVYESTNANAISLRSKAKKNSDAAEAKLENLKQQYGEKNWRVEAAKKENDSAFHEWKRLSEDAEIIKAPIAPTISDELRTAAQTIGLRAGLFIIVYSLMFVMRRLEGEEE